MPVYLLETNGISQSAHEQFAPLIAKSSSLSNSIIFSIILFIEFFPNQVLKLCNIIACNRRDKDMRNLARQVPLNLLHKLLVKHIGLGDGQNPLFIQQLRIIEFQLPKK